MAKIRTIKGNDGKGAREIFSRKIFGILATTVIVAFSLRSLVNLIRGKSDSNRLLHSKGKKRGLAMVDDPMKLVLSGTYHLVDIQMDHDSMTGEDDSYRNIRGEFCQLDWHKHKRDPSTYPMFRDLVKTSHCGPGDRILVDLKEAAERSREHDSNNEVITIGENGSDVAARAMHLGGFVFHESRCGSTLVANILAGMDPSHRVYSESAPFLAALRSCGWKESRCSVANAASLLRDVVYLMGRTVDDKEERYFYKVQSMGTKYLDVFLKAFPETPWIFVYRDPVEVIMSQLSLKDVSKANCVKQFAPTLVPDSVQQILYEGGWKLNKLKPEQKCATHMAALCASAIDALETSKMGEALNYKDLPNALLDSILPDHFKVPLSGVERSKALEISGTYSKARKENHNEWKDDSEKKQEEATVPMKEASELILYPFYHTLENLSNVWTAV